MNYWTTKNGNKIKVENLETYTSIKYSICIKRKNNLYGMRISKNSVDIDKNESN